MATHWHWIVVAAVFYAYNTFACNEAVCGSIVSKCLLLRSCDCPKQPIENCTW